MTFKQMAMRKCAALLAGLAATASCWAIDVQRELDFHIPSQSLAAALIQFSSQADVQVITAGDQVSTARSPGLDGRYSIETALRKVLAGTGFEFQVTGEGTISIIASGTRPAAKRDEAGQEGFWSGVRLAQASASADARTAESDTVDHAQETLDSPMGEILVRGKRAKLTTMKNDAPLLDVPQNVQILSSALLKDTGSHFLADALRNVAGVMPGGYFNDWDYFRIRGFESNVVYLDGLRLGTVINNAELFGLDRVEVIKGPASTLYGNLFSGMVNLASKRPEKTPFFKIGLTAGSFGLAEPTVDLGGSLNDTQSVYGRVVGLYRNTGSFVDFIDGLKRYYLAPSLTWEISPAAKLTVFSSYQYDINEVAFALPASGTVLPNPHGTIPRDRYFGDANDPGTMTHTARSVGYQFTYDLNSSVTFRQNARAFLRSEEWDRLAYPFFLAADQRTLYRFPYSQDFDWDTYVIDTGINAAFSTGSVRHAFTAGVDLGRSEFASLRRNINFADPASLFGMPFDLFDPNYDDFATPPTEAGPGR